ncbi:MAG: BamA/TamA family outer membrane protein, partial [Gemmatimonadales bacterium]|nr:BamA/TamA family outer membrane protein [Gemmatimonadales bacterium]
VRGAVWIAALVPSSLMAQADRQPQRTVSGVHFRGNHALAADTLAISIATTGSSWLAGLAPLRFLHLGQRRTFDELEFRRDVVRLQLLYRLHGYFEARVDTVVRRGGQSVSVTFRIQEGPPVIVDTIAIGGADSIVPADRLRHSLPLAVGRPFDRYLFVTSADSLVMAMRNRGYPFAEVYRSYSVDNTTRLARVGYDVVPGPRARVGEIAIAGAQGVSRRTVRRSLAVREGDVSNQDALFDSQRSLYQTDLFRYVSVGVAAESTVAGSDSLVRVQVQVQEGPRTRFRTGVGYGTIDCFRAQATLAQNNFLGGTRRLELAGKVSKLGFAHPTALGSRNVVCPELAKDISGNSRFSDTLNYLASITLTQPALFARRNAISITAFAERRSEFKAFERIGVGGSVSLGFGVGRDLPVTLTYRLAYGRTRAADATFCVFFDRCEQSAITQLSDNRRQAALGVSVLGKRTDNPVDPSRGHVTSLEAAYAGAAIGSQYAFAKIVGEAALYRRLSRDWVAAFRVRAGIVLSGLSTVPGGAIRFVPPEERFYLGGPSSVRGFGRNEMGPVVYVADRADTSLTAGTITYPGLRTSSLGSNAIALANLELRFPSPLLSSRFRLAAFVDAGQLWDQTTGGLIPSGWRATPGLGLRVATPLGPMRFDAAYNGYDRQVGPLYIVNKTAGTLDLEKSNFRGPARGASFLGRLQFHFSVGQAF